MSKFQQISDSHQQDFIKTSFFDEYIESLDTPSSPTFKKIWLTTKQFDFIQNIQTGITWSTKILHEGYLREKSRKKDTSKNKFYILYEDRLVKYDDQSKSKVKGILSLKGTKMDFIEEIPQDDQQSNQQDYLDDKFCFFITCNKKFEILFANSKEEFDVWSEKFKRCCILSYFGKYYQHLKTIGKGTFAKVILARRLSDGKEFAVKTFDKKNIINSKHANRTKVGLINEINIMRHLDHANIIRLYEVYEGEFHIYLVMDLLQGGELFDRIIQAGHLDERKAQKVLKQLLDALKYLHDRGIMHRDLKPENLILKSEDTLEIKLADFGLAEHINKNSQIFVRCGTPGYVAPEVLHDQKYDTKVDVFGAGTIFYILLTGCSVFSGDNYNEIINKNKNCIINWQFEKINIHLSDLCLDLLHKLLEKDPEKRITIDEALYHPWMQHFENNGNESLPVKGQSDKTKISSDEMKKHNLIDYNLQKEKIKREKLQFEPQDIIQQTPIMNGRSLQVQDQMEDFVNSPSLQARNIKQVSNLHQKVLVKNTMTNNPSMNKYLFNKDKSNQGEQNMDNTGEDDETHLNSHVINSPSYNPSKQQNNLAKINQTKKSLIGQISEESKQEDKNKQKKVANTLKNLI